MIQKFVVLWVFHLLQCGDITIGPTPEQPTTGAPPYPRQKSIFHRLNESHHIVYGGLDQTRKIMNDVFFISLKDDIKWVPMIIHGRRFPEPRTDCAHWMIDEKLYIWGGASATSLLSDLWVLDFEQQEWTKMTQSSTIPSPRQAPSIVTDGSTIYLFGGRSRRALQNDLWKLVISGNTGTWMLIEQNPTGTAPLL
ncbi:hypothetical protein BLNAU_23527 [Blattamonas nauphoetae]|uniref:Uncharacterized protein n=1 Tax=Blattamonas nauphoetae TaxID=2049346 RepID=A0ABQ9WQ01_9EUKA|nr:hypothetical protein BLNAU_23527 [Blattamonas nauphoetae]